VASRAEELDVVVSATLSHAQAFKRDGFIKLPAFFTAREMEELRSAILEAAANRADPLDRAGLTFHSNAFRSSPTIRDFLAQPRLVSLVAEVGGPNLWVRWDQAVVKAPGGVEFPWHQDNAYNRLRVQHFQLWIAVTRGTRENGGLWLEPGSHRRGLLPHVARGSHMVYEGPHGEPMMIEAECGDVVLFSSLMLHRTPRNESREDHRWAYVAEYIKLEDWDPWVDAPYFVVARDGQPAPALVQWFAGRLDPANRLRYLTSVSPLARRLAQSAPGRAMRRLAVLAARRG
jgi:ectoine hydroxylase-related dioxygenase (phytanoyl-CoA dioxygenase family)